MIPILSADHPALPLVKVIGNMALNTPPVTDADRPASQPPAGGPGMKVALFLALFLACSPAMAEVIPAQTLSVTEIINAMGAEAGYFHGFRAGHGYSYLATKIMDIGPESWNLTLNGGLIATSGLALTVDYDIEKGLSLQKFPVIGFFDKWKMGGGVMVTDITGWSAWDQFNKQDNRFDVGLDTRFVKKFGPQGK